MDEHESEKREKLLDYMKEVITKAMSYESLDEFARGPIARVTSETDMQKAAIREAVKQIITNDPITLMRLFEELQVSNLDYAIQILSAEAICNILITAISDALMSLGDEVFPTDTED